MPFERIAVIGAGTMGHGIAQVSAMAGYETTLYDLTTDALQAGLDKVRANLDKGVARGKVTEDQREAALVVLGGTTSMEQAVEGADMVVEAVPERLDLKQSLFRTVEPLASPGAVLATNTSSLSVGEIASGTQDPSRVIGTHFFNPVHINGLLEVIHHSGTGNDVIEAIRTYGTRIGKEVVLVRDFPGFATSRLGVALGMEAIRMVEQGVASAADIDRAMELGYAHKMGPLRTTDLVGLDVRMHIGAYLARELDNPAFEPPALMRRMVEEGKLGRKSGEGFYRW
ncbi:MAG: 3-hydroxyacyl-CoA dehydrogenase family protein [Myxococcota bacterium]|jgi:3-hydroxybutyryl-CoA dehydrogenase|nr:3-hydroxyacyl-CoA dehydrogenase family protein [Myxococcota bacterium]